jgi:hypothetical protein
MNMEEKIAMYQEKKQFIENLNEVFRIEPGCPTVEGVSYEVYQKHLDETLFPGITDYREWVVVHYIGGGKAPRIVSGNSNIANFVVIGGMLQGGCYEQVQFYEEQLKAGYERVDL